MLEADAIAREMMQPGARSFPPALWTTSGLAWSGPMARWTGPAWRVLAFSEGRLNELNQIVHPPVIAEQERRMNEIFARRSQRRRRD